MHPLKISLLKAFAFAFGLLSSSAVFAQPSTPQPSKADAGAKEEIKRSPSVDKPLRVGESRELAEARVQLDRLLLDYGEKHPSVAAQRAKIGMLEKLEPRKLDIDFTGGPVDQLMRKIEAVEGVSFNVVTGEGIRPALINLPAFSVRNVTVGTLMTVVRGLLPKEFDLIAAAVEPNSVVCILKRREGQENAPAAFGSFQLGPYLAEQSVDNIVAAIRAAWELDPAHEADALRLKFHQPTGILLASGPPQAVNIAHMVVSKLKRSAGEPPEEISEDNQIAREKARVEDWNAEIQRRRALRQNPPVKADEKK